jgi:phospholipid N-methyltransferase
MFQGLQLRSGDAILEYGPGTGAFTVAVEQLRQSDIDVKYLGIERDQGMYRHLLKRFPDLDFELGDVADVSSICAKYDFPAARLVVSGLPLIYMGQSLDQLLQDTRGCMREDGVFRTFSYVHCYPLKSANRVRGAMRKVFDRSGVSAIVMKNVPPALVLNGTIAS